MSVGFIELIAILLSLGGFGIDANPDAPSAAEVMRYAPASADFMVHMDVEAMLPRNYDALVALPGARALATAPDARAMLEDVIREVETARGMVKGLMGLDPVEGIHSVSAWIRVPAAGEPEVLVVARGDVSGDMIDRIATMAGAPTGMAHGHKTLTAPGGALMLAVTGDAILFGTPAWVQPRLAADWKPSPRHARNARAASRAAALAVALLDGKPLAGKPTRGKASGSKPFLAVVSSPSEAAVTRITQAVGAGGNVAVDTVAGHALAAMALYHDGVGWSVVARGKQGYERALLASEGLIALLRAGHHASRGAARLVLASLASYAGTDVAMATLLRHQDELLALADGMTGSGDFRVDFERQPRQRAMAVRARGSKLTDVVPIAGIAPVAGLLAYFTSVRRDFGASVDVQSEPAPQVAPLESGRLQVGDVYREVKRRRGLD